MSKYKNTSVDSIKEDESAKIEKNSQSNGKTYKPRVIHAIQVKYLNEISTSTTLGKDDVLFLQELAQSISSIDTGNSKKYSLTLEQARNRALKAVKRAKERNPSLFEEDD